jgi:tetratricopeptide (TPR) repeat protein
MRFLTHFNIPVAILALLACSPAQAQDVDQAIERYKRADYAAAESDLRKAVDAKADDAKANLYLGLSLLSQEKNSEAEPFLKKADQIESTGETKAALARYFAEQKDLGQAESMLADASGPEASYARGLVAFNKKEYESAASEMESFLESHPKHAYAHYYAGMAYNGLRRPDKMLTHLEMFLRLKPNSREARAVRAILKTGQ